MGDVDEPVLIAAQALARGDWRAYAQAMRGVRRAHEGNEEEWAWRELAKAHPAHVNLVEALGRIEEGDRSEACRWLTPAIAHLPTLSAVEWDAVVRFADGVESGFIHAPIFALAKHVERAPALAHHMGDKLRAADNEPPARMVATWAGAFGTGAPVAAARYALGLCDGGARDAVMLATLITRLPLRQNSDARAVIEPEGERVAEALLRALGQTDLVWSALTEIAPFSPSARAHLHAELQKPGPDRDLIIAVSNSLFLLDNTTLATVTGEPFAELVRRLAAIAVEQSAVRHVVDDAIGHLLYPEPTRAPTLAVLRELGSTPAIAEALKKTFEGLAQHADAFSLLLTEWLLDERVSFEVLGTMFRMCESGRAACTLHEATFAAATVERRVKAARRILAMVHHGPTVCAYAREIVRMGELGQERFEIASQMLDLTRLEYPEAVETFLARELEREGAAKSAEFELFRDIHALVVQWKGVLEALPRRQELRLSAADRQVVRALHMRRQREIIRIAEQQSVFAGLVHKVNMAQGRKFASHSAQGETMITDTAQYEQSIELPSSERADPMRGQLRRMQFVRGAR